MILYFQLSDYLDDAFEHNWMEFLDVVALSLPLLPLLALHGPFILPIILHDPFLFPILLLLLHFLVAKSDVILHLL